MMPANKGSLRQAALNRVGIRDPNVPVQEDQGQTSDDGWPDVSLYDEYYGRLYPPYDRQVRNRNDTLTDVNAQIQQEQAAQAARLAMKRLLFWRNEIGPVQGQPGGFVWQGGPPGAGMDQVFKHISSVGPMPAPPWTSTGVDEQEQNFNKYMTRPKGAPWNEWPADPEFYPSDYFPTTGRSNVQGLQTPVPNPGPNYIPPNIPTPPTPGERTGRVNTGPVRPTEYPRNEGESSRYTPEYWDKRRRELADINGGIETMGAGFMPPFVGTPAKTKSEKRNQELDRGVNWASKPDYGPSFKEPSENSGIWRILFGSGRKPAEPIRRHPSPKPKPPPRDNGNDFGRLIFGSRRKPSTSSPKPTPKVTHSISKPSSSNRSYPSSTPKPRRSTPAPVYRPPTRDVDVIDERPYVPPPPPPVNVNPAPVNPNYGKNQAPIRRTGGY